MREILFKGKSAVTGEWVEGYFYYPIISGNNIPCIIPCEELAKTLVNSKIYQIDPETVCQYTGLTDNNGKKIFEGEVVLTDDMYNREVRYPGVKYCVRMREGSWIAESSSKKWRFLAVAVRHGLEVIGNIFDNPDLLTTSSTDSD